MLAACLFSDWLIALGHVGIHQTHFATVRTMLGAQWLSG